MKKFLPFALIAGFSLTQVSAQRGIPRVNRKAMLDSLSPEQKQEFRKNLRAKYDSLSPEQKKELRDRIKSKADSLSPEQKARLRKRLRNNKTDNR